MAIATVYTLDKNNMIVDQFDCDWDFAIQQYYGQKTHKGSFYIGRKGVKVPYKTKRNPLKKFYPHPESSEVQG